MWGVHAGAAIALVLAALGSSAHADDPAGSPAEARKGEFEERTRRALVQLDVTVEGPPEIVGALTAEDFDVRLGGRKIRDYTVDRFCGSTPARPIETPPVPEAAAEPNISGVNYLFYFDQHHLTFRGRNRSTELAHALVDDLIHDGNRATVVSSGRRMRTFAGLTDDPAVLHAAIDEMTEDPEQFDSFPMQEDGRVEDVLDQLTSFLETAQLERSPYQQRSDLAGRPQPGYTRDLSIIQGVQGPNSAVIEESFRAGLGAAKHVARDYQREEWWRTDRALTRFSLALSRMANFEFPKAAIYFADTMRANAGQHYLGLLGDWGGQLVVSDQGVTVDAQPGGESTTNVPSFDRVIEEAAAQGVRLYTIQAEGLVVRAPMTRLSSRMTESFATASATAIDRRFNDAESSLVGFAMETGGQAFLKGASAENIAGEILGDMDCVYLVSFDPEQFPEDRALPVRVEVDRPGVEARARGLMTIRSESARLTSKLMAAFAAPEEVRGTGQLVAVLIPTGFDDGKYTALAQLIVSGSSQPQVDWDVGISMISGSRVREHTSGRISVRGRDVPVVLETVVHLAPGAWELTGVAHESVSGEISAFRLEGDWPDPKDEGAMVGPIALLQPVYAVFMRDGTTRREGSLGRAEREPVRTDLPTALVGLVCRDRTEKGPLSVERRLIGEDFVEFPVIELAAGGDRCAVVTDVIPARTMTAGMFQYELRVRGDDGDIASGIRELAALDPQ